MRIHWINKDDKHGGRPPWAYAIDRPFPKCREAENGYFFHTLYDCKDRAQGGLYQTRCTIKTPTGYDTFWVQGYGYPSNHNFKGFNYIQDMRTIEMMMRGCCPQTVLLEFMGTEGIPD